MDTLDASVRAGQRLWVERLLLTNFRNYVSTALQFGPSPVVLVGPNGAGKTNLMEAVSLLSVGHGLRQAAYADVARLGGRAVGRLLQLCIRRPERWRLALASRLEAAARGVRDGSSASTGRRKAVLACSPISSRWCG
jgi:recombinational DNA repair ATPase RecF